MHIWSGFLKRMQTYGYLPAYTFVSLVIVNIHYCTCKIKHMNQSPLLKRYSVKGILIWFNNFRDEGSIISWCQHLITLELINKRKKKRKKKDYFWIWDPTKNDINNWSVQEMFWDLTPLWHSTGTRHKRW